MAGLQPKARRGEGAHAYHQYEDLTTAYRRRNGTYAKVTSSLTSARSYACLRIKHPFLRRLAYKSTAYIAPTVRRPAASNGISVRIENRDMSLNET